MKKKILNSEKNLGVNSGRLTHQFNLVFKTIKGLPKKKYKLIDIGAGGKHISEDLPDNVEYSSLDYKMEQDYVFDLNKGRIPIKDNTFDIVVCLETLEHLLEPHKVMKELLRIGKEDAIFILSMPNEYNFVLRFYYLFGIKTNCQESFEVVSKHFHIHIPRVKDIINFLSEYINIEEKDFIWQSRSSKNNTFVYVIDRLINLMAKIMPSLFTRLVIVKGKRKGMSDMGMEISKYLKEEK